MRIGSLGLHMSLQGLRCQGMKNIIWELFGRELLNRKFEWAFIEVLRSLGWRASESRQMGIYAV